MSRGSKDFPANPEHIMVLGVGNILLKDEGFGVHTIWELEKRRDELNLPPDVEIIDGGTLGLDLLHFIENKDRLIVVDIINAGASPGTIFRFKPQDIQTLHVKKLSFHQVTLFDVLTMAEGMGKAPKETIIIAVQPKEIGWGMEPTEELKKKIPKVIELVVKELKRVKS